MNIVRTSRSTPILLALVAGLVILAHAPMLTTHLRHLWQSPQYQFFPLLIIGVSFLIWFRWPRERETATAYNVWSVAFLVLAGCLLALALAIFSYKLAAIAAVLATGGLLFAFTGSGFLQILPAWALLLFLVPLPFAMDTQVVFALQTWSARTCSLALDACGLNHHLAVHVLELPGRRFLVNEACSGVNSLFALAACAGLLAVWYRRSLLHTLILMPSAIVWSGLANVMRLIAIAVAYERYSTDLTVGWLHELLGIATFLIGAALVLTTDRWLSFLLAPIASPFIASFDLGPLSRGWNWLLGTPSKPNLQDDEDEPLAGETDQPSHDKPVVEVRPTRTWPIWSAVVVFGALAAVQLPAVSFSASQSAGRPVDKSAVAESVTLPRRLGNWRLAHETAKQHTQNSVRHAYSKTWILEGPEWPAYVSLYYPFHGWHELSNCYRSQGWHVSDRFLRSPTQPELQGQPPFVLVELTQPTGEHGLLAFSLFDGMGQIVAPPDNFSYLFGERPFAELVRQRLRVQGPIWQRRRATSDTFQVQLFIMTHQPLSPKERDEVCDTFAAIRREVTRQFDSKATHTTHHTGDMDRLVQRLK